MIKRTLVIVLVFGLALLLTFAAPRKSGDWTSYDGELTGNRHSTLTQITSANVNTLVPSWNYPISNAGDLEVTPLVSNGVMYVTGVNAVYALNAATGAFVWSYSRPKSTGLVGDAAIGLNRGVAIYNDRLFMVTDNAHVIALRLTDGHLLWETTMDPNVEQYGSTGSPLVVKNKVIAGVSGGDNGVRGFLAAYDVLTGQLSWRFNTVPAPGDPLASTWGASDLSHPCGATWMTGTYDNLTDLLYWTVGNPCPDFDGAGRIGDNLYTSSVLALKPDTGLLQWYFQFTPHDRFDFDGQAPVLVVDTAFQGASRKLLLQANKNGFFYVLDRSNGQFLLGKPFVQNLNWATGLEANGRPIPAPGKDVTPGGVKICPAVGGGTNWQSTAFNPATGYFYVNAMEQCDTISTQGITFDPAHRFLRAINIQNGNIAWEYAQSGNGGGVGGVLSTAGNLVFFGTDTGDFTALNATTGSLLWSAAVSPYWHASPMTYSVNSKQYVAAAAPNKIVVFALP